ncbi:MAG: hydrogenase maturation nickel metallochaperone HypA [Deltaproteobacteria bacterium]|nr:hydrogenase maturation nickel metallochaperone HypA [Deltaproteobacteria bacterium]
MHEMSIAQSLVDIIQQEMMKHHAKALKSVRLHVGQLSAVVPDSLSFCFEVITKGTEMEGAELIMDVIPLEGLCKECKETFHIKDYAFLCPHCGSKEIETIAGQDLSIREMEVD